MRTGERFGTEHLISILIGEENDAILRLGHNGLKTFGVGKDRSKTEWRSLLRQIYALGLIALELVRIRPLDHHRSRRRRARKARSASNCAPTCC